MGTNSRFRAGFRFYTLLLMVLSSHAAAGCAGCMPQPQQSFWQRHRTYSLPLMLWSTGIAAGAHSMQALPLSMERGALSKESRLLVGLRAMHQRAVHGRCHAEGI